MKTLCTFPGKFGDILWSLATVKQISQQLGEKVDFATMPTKTSLLGLLQMQPYIANAFVLQGWVSEHDGCGEQPWQPQIGIEGYDTIYHLGYRGNPGSKSLMQFIAEQQNRNLDAGLFPYIETDQSDFVYQGHKVVALGFSRNQAQLVDQFLDGVLSNRKFSFIDVTALGWREAAAVCKRAVGFVGSRSSNYILAGAVGQRNVFVYEPEKYRHPEGAYGNSCGFPNPAEQVAPFAYSPSEAAARCQEVMEGWGNDL